MLGAACGGKPQLAKAGWGFCLAWFVCWGSGFWGDSRWGGEGKRVGEKKEACGKKEGYPRGAEEFVGVAIPLFVFRRCVW